MSGPSNGGRYQRRYTDPRTRPSNMPFGLWASAETLRTVHGLNEWLDAQQGAGVVAAAEQLLSAEAGRLQRQKRARAEGWVQGGQPGE
jgi:hypothetical protein